MKSYILKIGNIDILVEKKKIKNMYLKAIQKTNSFKISAPSFATEKQIREFAFERKEWIEKNFEIMKSKREELNQKKYCLFGENLERRDNTVKKGFGVEKNGNILVFNIGENFSEEKIHSMYYEFLRKNLEEVLPHLIWECENVSGLYANSYKVRKMETRWGSCSVKTKDIRLSLKLAEKNVKCIKYVIYHELTHIKVPNHSKNFYLTLEKCCPEWKMLKEQMKA